MKTTMKKLISSILVLCMLLTLVPTAVYSTEASEEQVETTTAVQSPELSVDAPMDSGRCGENAYWEFREYGSLGITGTGAMYNYAFDDAGNSTAPWQAYADLIGHIWFAEGITSIGDLAFYELENAIVYHFPESITSIGNHAFEGCTSLSPSVIPINITSIGDFAFARTGIEDLVIPDRVSSIGMAAFSGCQSLRNVALPDGIADIGISLFKNCSSLASIAIPASVTSVESESFMGCTSLSEIYFVGNAPVLESDCFAGVTAKAYYPAFDPTWTEEVRQDYCGDIIWIGYGDYVAVGDCGDSTGWKLTQDGTLTICGSGAVNVGNWQSVCSAVKKIVIEEGITETADYAFHDFSAITEITIPKSMKSIAWHALSLCPLLEKVNYPGTITELQRIAQCRYDEFLEIFNGGPLTHGGCGENSDWELSEDGLLVITGTGKADSYAWRDAAGNKRKAIVSEGITELTGWRNEAFAGCVEVTIPISLEHIDEGLFIDDVQSLRIVNYPGTLEQLKSICDPINDDLLDAFRRTQLLGIEDGDISWELSSDGTLTISGSGKMCDYCLDYDYELYDYSDKAPWDAHKIVIDSVVIQDGVTSIGDSAFYDFDYLHDVIIPDSVLVIGKSAFCFNYSLNLVEIPANVAQIESRAFSCCYSLSDIIFAGSAPTFGYNCFYNVTATAYYPANDPTWTEEVRQDYGGNITWVGVNNECPSAQFTDVPKPGHWAHEGVDFVVSKGLFNGMSATTFGPNEPMTRGMLVTVLWRMVGQPKPAGLNPFADVREQYFAVPVMWAAENGIVNGVGHNRFDPNGNITREQMASILYRYAQMSGINTADRADLSFFPDAGKVSDWAKESMEWAVASGLISGSSVEGVVKLLPRGNATRAQVATILQRFIDQLLDNFYLHNLQVRWGEISGNPVVFYGKPSDIRPALDAALTDAGISFTDVENDDPASISAAIKNGAGLLLVTLSDTAKAQQIIDLARPADIPLVFFDCDVPESIVTSYDRCVLVNTTDEQIGRTMGSNMGDFLGYNFEYYDRDSYQDNVITYIMLKDDGSDAAAASCTAYAVEAANLVLACRYGHRAMCYTDDWESKYAISAPAGGWTSEAAKQVVLDILQERKETGSDLFEAILVNNEAAAMGVAEALLESGYNTSENLNIPVFAFGSSDEIAELVRTGVITFSAANDAANMAQAICRMIQNANKGESVFYGLLVKQAGLWEATLANRILTGE